jgi:hypothetical protein
MAGFPNNSFDVITSVDGDKNIYISVFETFSGSGGWRINYLLKRDLDPASNDDSPVGLNRAA